MPNADTRSGGLDLRVVYYGPPGAGKMGNLELISALLRGTESRRLTPRQVGENRVATLEIPAGSLGPFHGSSVAVSLETMQGEVSGGGWSEALTEADGIVFVVDSGPHARTANFKALGGLRERLEGRGRSAGAVPVVLQWNKRDRTDARPIAELETELNHRCFPSIEASSQRGTGVVETLIEILKRTIHAALRKAGDTSVSEVELAQSVTAAIQRLSESARAASIRRFGMTIERQPAAWPEVREPMPREAIYSAESIGEDSSASRMLAALGDAASSLDEQGLAGLPHDLMAGLLAGCDRAHGSLLVFRQGTPRMEEREVVPAGPDPLNAVTSPGGVSNAAALCAGRDPRFIGDLGTERHRSALVVPLVLGTHSFGGMIVYVADGQLPPSAAEHAYWKTAAALTSIHLAWQADRDRAVAPHRTGRRPDVTLEDAPDS